MNTLLSGNLISTKDASALSGYNADYLSRLCRSGKIHGEQIGRAWLIERSSLEAFMAAQVMRKIELSESLAREREEEYRRLNQAEQDMTVRMQDGTDRAVNSVMSVLSKMRMPHTYPAFSGRAASFALTALVIGASTLVAGSGIVEKTGGTLVQFAFETRSLALDSMVRASAYASERHDLLASRAMREVRMHDLLLASVSDSRFEMIPSEIWTGLEVASEPRQIPAIALTDASPLVEQGADATVRMRTLASRAAADPAGALIASYVGAGGRLLRIADAALAAHLDATYVTADALLSFGADVRDASSRALDTYQEGVYAYVRNAELMPRAVFSAVYGLGDLTATNISGGIQRTPERYDAGVATFVALSQKAGERIAQDSSAFGNGSREVVAALLETQDRSIAHAVDSSRVALGANLDTVGSVPSSIASALEGSATQLTAAAANAQALVASPLGAFKPAQLIEDFTQSILTFFSDATSGIAGLFGVPESGLIVIPSAGPDEAAPVQTIVHEEGDTIIYEGPVTVVNNHNEYPALTYSGVPESYVDAQITLLNDRLIRSIDNSHRASRGGTLSINGLTGTGLTLNSSTWNGGTITGAALDVLDTSVTGTLSVDGPIETSQYIAGPYVLATSTTATSAFSGNIAVGRNATFGTTAADLLTFNSSIASSLSPAANNMYDLGASGNIWRRGYFDEIVVNNFSVASTSIAGTGSNVFTVNADNATNDAEDSSLLFNRGASSPHALMTWNASTKRFEFNMPVYSANGIFGSATTTNLATSNFSLGGSLFTSLLGTGLQNTGGALTVDTSALAGSFFTQSGNSFGSTATLGTNDGQALQFETGNVSRMTILANGNVGVGTTTPLSKLDVYGTGSQSISVTGTGPDAYLSLINQNAGGRSYLIDSGGNGSGVGVGNLGFYDTTAGATRMVINSTGNVGIGTTSPATLLSVAGNGFLTGGLGIGAVNTTAGSVLATGNYVTTGTSAYFGATTNFNAFIPFDNGGRTGINSGGSFYLNIDSNSDQTDRAFVVARDSSALSSGTELFRVQENGNVGIGTSSPQNLLSLSSNTNTIASIDSTLTTGTSRLYFTEGGTLKNYLQSIGSAHATTDFQNDLQIVSGSGDLSFWPGGAQTVTFKLGGNVGIGTTTPTGRLTVYQSGLTSTDGIYLDNAGNNSGRIYVDTNGALNLQRGTNNGQLALAASGNVGIGTSNPGSTLDVTAGASGNVNQVRAMFGTGNGNSQFVANRQATSNTAAITFQTNSVTDWAIGEPYSSLGGSGSDFHIYEAGASSRLTILKTSGNVGIGTTSPSYVLDVSGSGSNQARISSTGTLYNILDLSAYGTGGGVQNMLRFNNGASTAWSFGVNQANGNTLTFSSASLLTSAPRMVLTTAGNVGIGTTTPGSTLHLYSANTSPLILERSTAGNSNSNILFKNQSNSIYAGLFPTGGFAIGTNSDLTASPQFVINSSGNVGIGTSSPSAKLTIQSGVSGASQTLWNILDSAGLSQFSANITSGNAPTFVIGNVAPITAGTALTVDNNSGAMAQFSRGTNVVVGISGNSNIPQVTLTNTGKTFDLNVTSNTFRITDGTTPGTNDRLVIDSNGNIGISTSSPTARFTLAQTGSGSRSFEVFDTAVSPSTYVGLLSRSNNVGGGGSTSNALLRLVDNSQNYPLSIETTAGTSLLAVRGNGNVGIGTSSPVAKLDVGGQIGTPGAGIGASAGIAAFSANMDNTAGIEMRNTSAGGGASFRFAISDNNANDYMAFEQSSTGNGGSLFGMTRSGISTLFTNGTGNRALAIGTVNAGAIVLGTSNAERFRITSTGSIGIGTSSPQNTLELYAGNPAVRTTLSGTSGAAEWIAYEGSVFKGGFSAFGSTYPTTNWRDAVMLTAATDNTGSLIFRTRTSGSYNERMTITNAGSVGIGTTSPNFTLDVNGTASFGNVNITSSSIPANGIYLSGVNATGISTGGARILFVDSGGLKANSNSGAQITGQTGSATSPNILPNRSAINTGIGASGAGAISFINAGVNTMELTSTGNVGIGTTTPTAQLHTTGTVRFSNFAAGTLQTDADGNVTASSDERLKNIQGSFARGLSELMAVNPITYRWKASTGYDTANNYSGFSAQNVQSAIPEAVDTDPRGYLTLSDRPILAASVNAIKELNLRTLSLAPAETNAGAKNLEVSADASVAGKLSVSGTGSFAQGIEATDVKAARVLVPKTDSLPAEVLTGGDADLYKMAKRGMVDGAEALRRTDLVMEKLATIDQRLAELEAAAHAPGTIPVIEGLSDIISRFSIRDGLLSAVELVAERLTVGSSEKPTGVTFYDEVTGEPYCLAIRNGAQVIREGECGVVDRMVPEMPVTSEEPLPSEPVSTSTPASPDSEVPSEPVAPADPVEAPAEPISPEPVAPAEPAVPEPVATPEPAPSPEPAV